MTAKDLKSALLQEAVQGKLVPQIASEGNARDLLEEIRKEKTKLVKEGKLKKEKPLPEIIEDEIPFDIPENWCWCRLGEIVPFGTCKNAEPNEIEEEDWILDLEDIEKDSGKIIAFKTKKQVDAKSTKHVFIKGNVLYSKLRPYLNKCVIAPKNGFCTSEILPLDFGEHIYNKYAQLYLMSPFFVDYTNSLSFGVKMPRLGTEDGKKALFPLPPFAEQKRIVVAIEKFKPLIEEYDKKETELKAFNEQIGTLTKKAILQEAVQGKLVPQIAAEGNAKDLLEEIKKEKAKLIKEGKLKKEKSLPEITEDDIPFEIPDNWCWCRFGDIFQHNTGKTQNSSVETKNGTLRKFITTSNLYWNRFDFTKVKEMLFSENELTRCTVTKGDLLICEGGEYGRAAIWNYDYDVCFQNHVHRARAIKENTLHLEFYYYLLYLYKSIGLIEGRGVGIKSLSTENLHQIIIPLPPYNEQKRIITAITQVLSICEKIGN